MFSSFEESYKKELLESIKENIKKYNDLYLNNGFIELNSKESNNIYKSKSEKVIKTFISIWFIIIFLVISVIVYKEVLVSMNINISLQNYIIGIVVLFFVLLISIFSSTKTIKRINKIILDKNFLNIYVLNDNNPIKYELNDIKINCRHRRKSTENVIRGNAFNLYFKNSQKNNEYILHAINEIELFVFLIFVDEMLNNLKVSELSDEKLYQMYHTKKYGLKLSK